MGLNSLNKYPAKGTKPSNGEASIMLELYGRRSTPSLPSLTCPFWPGVRAPGRVLSMGQRELN